jgi:hypothetical protein
MRRPAGTGAFDVRAYLAAPGRRRLLAIAAGVLVALALAFQLGRMQGASGDRDAVLARRELEERAAALEGENREAARRIARLETDARVDREAYARVAGQLAELQGKLIEQQEEVAFYRGIVGGPGEGGLRVQEFALTGTGDGAVRLRFVLAQPESAAREVSGKAQIRIEGMREGRLVSVDAASLAPAGATPLVFRFRYFQELAVALRPPRGFAPERIVIRIQPSTGGVKSSVESFPWTVSAG